MSKAHYETLGPLLSGTGSRAYLALCSTDGRDAEPVVLVWLPEEISSQPELVSAIERDTQRAALLDHPHIVRVFGLLRQEHASARVVEYVDGESLRRVLEIASTLPAAVAARLISDAALGIHYGHLAGNDDGTPLIHGDIRPETLLVSFRGVAKVSGYGGLVVAPKKPGDRRVRGRRLHCAPEQVVGGRDAASVETDVYLLASVLYECLTGKAPFIEAPDVDFAILSEPLPALPEALCPRALATVLERALSKKAADRFPTALAFRDALEEALGGLPSHLAFAEYLKSLFPEDDPARVTRRQLIEKGLAAKTSNGLTDSVPETAPTALPQPPSPFIPSVKPGGPGMVFWACVVIGAILVPIRLLTLPARPGALPPRVSVDSTPPATNLPPTPASNEVQADNGTLPAATPAAPSSTEVNPASDSKLSVYVEPTVEVAVDGKPLGRAPVTLAIPSGQHVLRLTDPKHGISASRKIFVRRGSHLERIYLKRGYVNVVAPKGASIFIDGKPRGKAPQRELGIFEGKHKLVVTSGSSKWQESFQSRPNQRLRFNFAE